MSRVSVGDRFCRLVVVDLISDRKNPKAKCICDCGNVCYPQRGSLKNGRAKSCGCKKMESLLEANKTHGMSRTSTYKVWIGMLARCSNTKLPSYKNYGGRGIKVLWKSFDEFLNDMGLQPPGHWIDRLDNNYHYCKENCKWVLPKANLENTRKSKLWIINGNAYGSSTEAATALEIDVSTVNRNCNGYSRNGRHYPPKNGWSCALKYNAA